MQEIENLAKLLIEIDKKLHTSIHFFANKAATWVKVRGKSDIDDFPLNFQKKPPEFALHKNLNF